MITDKLKNGSSTLSFSLYKNHPFIDDIQEEFYVETIENRYVIKNTNDQQTVKRYMCVLDLESLESKLWIDGFSNVEATADATVRLAIAGTGWSVESRSLTTKKRTLRLDSMNAYEIITKALTKWDIEVRFNAKDKVITLSDNIGEDKGVYFTDELNLSTINIEGDSTDFATRLYVRGKDGLTFADINGGKDYIENFTYSDKVVSKLWVDERYEHKESMLEDARIKLEGMCKPIKSYELEIVDLASLSQEYDFLAYGIGDTVTLLSASNKIRESHRIIEMTRYPLEPERNKAVLSNGRLTFEELQQKNEEMADTVDGWANEDGTLNGSKVDGILTEQITDFEAKVAQITDLTVVNAKIDNLEANKASIGQLSAVVADIGELRANTATIDQLKATNAQIDNLKAQNVTISGNLQASNAQIGLLESSVANIEKLYATKADIDELRVIDANIQNAMITKADIHDLNAAVADIGILNADLATIKHLVGGNISSENIQSGGITSDKLTIANGFIKDAMIDSLNANKIVAGRLDTALVQVASASGNLVINDNTIQIRDANRVRVQIGKDASNDYSMSVWDSSGKLMFDARGLKADAIKDSIIRNDMVAPGANIDGSKLNISSVVSSINNSSSTLKASKVEFDGIAQTLEVAFNALKVEVDETKSITESNTTAINVAQGKINTLIQDTTITKNGQTIKLKDEYSRLEQTVSGLSSTVGAQQTIIDANTGKITATNSELSSLKQNVNGLSASVSTAQTTLESHTTQINNKADLSVVDSKFNDLKIGVANDLRNGNFLRGLEHWSVHDPSGAGGSDKMVYVVDGDNQWRPLGKKTLEIRGTMTTNRYGVASSIMKLDPNTQYTVSGYCAGHRVEKIQINVRDMNNSSANIFTKDFTPVSGGATLNTWHRFELTFTTSSNTDFLLNLYSVKFKENGFVWFCDVQIQKGTKATAFVECAEDIQSSIDTKANITDVYNKTEVYTKAQTDSQINIAKDAINLGVSTTYETKANVESKATVTLNSAKSYADTKKQEAINTASSDATTKANKAKTDAINSASSDATNKVNSAKNELNTEINKKVNSVDVYKKSETYTKAETDSKIKVAKDAIDLSVSTLQTTVTNHTTQINNKADLNVVNQKIDNLSVSATNLLDNSAPLSTSGWSNWSSISGLSTNMEVSTTDNSTHGKKGKITFSGSVEGTAGRHRSPVQKLTSGKTYSWSIWLRSGSGSLTVDVGAEQNGRRSVSVGTSWTRFTHTFVANDSQYFAFIVRAKNITSANSLYFHSVMLVEGDKPVAWQTSPTEVLLDKTNIEKVVDTKANITDVYNKTEVYTKAQTDSQIKVAKDSITQSVSSTYETKTNVTTQINGVKNTISSLQTRVNTAEQKITDSAIVSTVTSSQTYRDNLNGKVSTNQIISSINQTAESIKINAGKIDLSGYVTISNLSGNGTTSINGANIKTGVIKSTDSSFHLDLNNGRMAIYDSNKLLVTTHKMRDNKSGKYGMGILANNDSFIALGLGDNDDNTIYKPYIALAAKSFGEYKPGINIKSRVEMDYNTLSNGALSYNGFKRNSGDYVILYASNNDSSYSKLIMELGDDNKTSFEINHKFYNKSSVDRIASFRAAGGSDSDAWGTVGINFYQHLSMNNYKIWGAQEIQSKSFLTVKAAIASLDVEELALNKIARFNIGEDIKYRIPAGMQESIEYFGHADLQDNYCRVNLPIGFNHRGYIVTLSPLSSGDYEITKNDEYFEVRGNIKSFDYIVKGFI